MEAATTSTQDFNRRAMECSNHRMRQISYEAVYADKYQYGEPVKEVYTFKCSGTCGQSYQLITKPTNK